MRGKPPTILLVNPWIYDFAAYNFWVKPLGLLYVAALLRKNGYEVHFADCLRGASPSPKKKPDHEVVPRDHFGKGPFIKEHEEKPPVFKEIPRHYSRYGISPSTFCELLETIPEPRAILVTSVMTYWYPGVFHAIRILRRYFSNVPIILGGIYATLCASHARLYSGADHVIEGEGEMATTKLVDRITGHHSPHTPLPDDLDELPYPAMDLLSDKEALAILTSRGCPYRCPYCVASRLTPSLRRRDPKRVADEIEYWVATTDVRDFAFYDDALAVQPERHMVPLLTELSRRRIRCRFHLPNGVHVGEITREVAARMFEMNFKTIRLGLEFADDTEHRAMGSKTNREAFRNAVSYLREAGFSSRDIGAYLLVGLPGQKARDVEKAMRFVVDCGAEPYLAEYSPIPGTRLFEEACRNSPFDLAADPITHNNSALPCRSEAFTWEDLDRLKRLRSELTRRGLKESAHSVT